MDLLHRFVTQGTLPDSLEEFVYDVGHEQNPGSVRLLPAGNAPSESYWKKLAAIPWHDLFYSEPDPPGIPFFEELRLWIEQSLKPDFLLIDSRTGITEIGGVAMTVMSDMVVCLLVNNPENLEGVRAVLRSIRRAPRPEGREPVEIVPVLTRIPKGMDTTVEKKILDDVRAELNQEALNLADTLALEEIFLLHSDPSLQMLERLTMDSQAEKSHLMEDYLSLFSRLVPRGTFGPPSDEPLVTPKDRC